MPGITRKATDKAGGVLITGSANVFVNGADAVRIGDKVARHGSSPHDSPDMVTGSDSVFVNGTPVCRAGDKASCGHIATGSDNVIAG
jgi:uncharacterized Zn-binding protein involved in type VI secretion